MNEFDYADAYRKAREEITSLRDQVKLLQQRLEPEPPPETFSSWLQSKVASQKKALHRLNKRVFNQRLQLRALDDLGHSLSKDEFEAAREKVLDTSPALASFVDEIVSGW